MMTTERHLAANSTTRYQQRLMGLSHRNINININITSAVEGRAAMAFIHSWFVAATQQNINSFIIIELFASWPMRLSASELRPKMPPRWIVAF
mmetsp:Transcript_18617/g.37580  ORF Transcript_18617/g.37580 Transcript_18617/m.37580 type:complete len:93 (-) Transcript_18617:258-536(-)